MELIRKTGGTFKVLVGKCNEGGQLARPKRLGQVSIKTDHKEVFRERVTRVKWSRTATCSVLF